MSIYIDATYRDGVIHPSMPLNLPENTPVRVTLVPRSGQEPASLPPSPRFTADELSERIAEFGVSVGTLPADFSRADIYSDHD